MPATLYSLISILCALQGILLSLVFFRKRNLHPANLVLGIYIFLFSIGMLENYLQAQLSGIFGRLVYSFLGFSNFLYGPLLYFFIFFLTVKEPCFNKKHLFHLLPFAFLAGSDTVFI